MGKLKSIKFKWAELIVILLLVTTMFTASAITWSKDPVTHPTYSNAGGSSSFAIEFDQGADGQIILNTTKHPPVPPLISDGRYDGYERLPRWNGNPTWGLFGLPLLVLGIYALSILLPKLDPRRENYRKFEGTYRLAKLLIIAFITVNYWMSIAWSWGANFNSNQVNFILIGLLAIVIGNFMSKLRSNWFIGILTPFTLASEESWIKTHRKGGRLLVIWGLAVFIRALFFYRWALWIQIYVFVFTGYALVAAIGLVIYSYLVWRKDPNARILIIRRAWRASDHAAACEE